MFTRVYSYGFSQINIQPSYASMSPWRTGQHEVSTTVTSTAFTTGFTMAAKQQLQATSQAVCLTEIKSHSVGASPWKASV